MKEIVHILHSIPNFTNLMFCGEVKVDWVDVYGLEVGGDDIDNVTCEECRDAYSMQVLGEL